MRIVDYESPTRPPAASRWRWLHISLAVTPVAIATVVLAGAAGHGTYLPFKLIFPYTMLAFRIGNQITLPFMLVGLLQIPTYGLVISGTGEHTFWRRVTLAAISIVHLVAVASVLSVQC